MTMAEEIVVPDGSPVLYTPPQAAKILGISYRVLLKVIRAKDIRVMVVGYQQYRLTKNMIEEYIARQTIKPKWDKKGGK